MTARDRAILAVVCVIAAAAAGWLLVVQPKRNQASQLGSQITTAQQQLAGARAQVAAAQLARNSFSSSYTVLARLGEAVPADDDVPSLIYQIQNAATGAGVDFRSLTLNPGGASGTTPTTTTSSASAAQAVTAVLPPGATVGPAGLPIEPFTFTFRGSFFHLADFFGRLQQFVTVSNKSLFVRGRLMTLNAISLSSGPAGFPQIVASVSATTYLVPASQGVMNGATPTGPSSSSTVGVSTTPSSSTAAPAVVVTPTVR
jgi:type II secretory pathway pseudopilin PulG